MRGRVAFSFTFPLGTNAPISQGDLALRVTLILYQSEVALWEAGREERNAIAEQDGNDAQEQLVNQISLQKAARQLAPAHVKDVLAAASTDFPKPGCGGLIGENDPIALAGRLFAGEDMGGGVNRRFVGSVRHGNGRFQSLASHDDGVDSGEEVFEVLG